MSTEAIVAEQEGQAVSGTVIEPEERTLPATHREGQVATVTSNPSRLLELAIQKDADIEKLEKLMDLQERWDREQARKAFADALSAFQSAVPPIRKRGHVKYPSKDANKDGTEFHHARLEDIAEAINPHLREHGLSYRFEQNHEMGADFGKNCITVTCIVTHRDGHSERTSMPGFPDTSGSKNPIQSMGSTVTYLRRYTLLDALGLTVCDEDNDGQDAAETVEQQGAFYTDEQFQAMLPKWQKAILEDSKEPQTIINFVASKGRSLTDEQQQILHKTGK